MLDKRRAVVIGIDGGGTHSRALCVNLDGAVIARAEGRGCTPALNPDGAGNIQRLLADLLDRAEVSPGDVSALCAGLAGLNAPGDAAWATTCVSLQGFACPLVLVNDGVVAHAGAMPFEPGLVAMTGTFGLAVGVRADGRFVHSHNDLGFVTGGGGGLVTRLVWHVLAGDGERDQALVQQLLAFAHVESEAALLARWGAPQRRRPGGLGRFAPQITAAAERGSSLARLVCDRTLTEVAFATRLVAAAMEPSITRCSLSGSVLLSPYMSRNFHRHLTASGRETAYTVVEARLSPVAGAVLLALRRAERAVDEGVVMSLEAQNA